MKKMLLICCGLALSAALQAQIIHVPGAYPTIQQGINAATPGDTVLVAEGTYYEQINFKGKKPLVVASLFSKDGDTSHIRKTIIDGSQITKTDSASVVYFISGEDTTSVLCGFTITRGKGTKAISDGYTFREGGGVFIDGSSAKIIYNHITENHLNDTLPGNAQVVSGAGICNRWEMGSHWVVIDHNIIDHNSCFSKKTESSGAGIGITYNSRITNNTISDNTSKSILFCPALAGGFFCTNDPAWTVQSTAIAQHNIIKNNLSESQNNFANSAGAMFSSVNGIFSDNEVTGNKVNTWQYTGGVAGICIHEPDAGFMVRNNIFKENISNLWNGGLGLQNNSQLYNPVLIESNYFFDNKAKAGAAFVSFNVPVKLQNNVFRGNKAIGSGGAIYLGRVKNTADHLATLINNSFSGNTAGYGGAIASTNSKPLIINSVFWGDSAVNGREICLFDSDKAEIANTAINPSFILGTVIDGGGNLNQDPLFKDNILLTLFESSICIDKGTFAYNCQCLKTHNCPLYDITGESRPQGSSIDMGAYEYDLDGIDEVRSQASYSGIGNYPNPFKGSTTFTYKLNESSQVKLQIFNNLGLLVAEPLNEFQQNGEQKVNWNAKGMPAGIYYCRLQAGEQVRSVKIIKME